MPRFVCSHSPTLRERFVLASGRTLSFDYRGVLHTDDEGAAVIRGHPLYGRLILEVDDSAPPHKQAPAPALDVLPQVTLPGSSRETPEQRKRREKRRRSDLEAW